MEAKRCNGCMKQKTQSPLCEHCGYNENIDNLPHQLPIGTVLKGQYQIGKVLGQGGFGITYIGWDTMLQMVVAIKEYYPESLVRRNCAHSLSVRVNSGASEDQFGRNRERFLNEARTLAKFSRIPEIVHIHSLIEENNTAYIVMEYVQGMDLRRYINVCGGKMTADQTFQILRPVMRALAQVHEQDLVHRDISPDNIMILPDGRAKLLDFGAAREVVDPDVEKQLSRSTEAILKHGFAPMEQYQRNGTLGPWTDVYALCATVYYCLTGEIPPDAPNRIMEGKEVSWDQIPGLSSQQAAVLKKGMSLIPKERISSVAELEKQLFGQSPSPKPVPDPDPEPETKSTRKWIPAAVAAVIALVVGVAAFSGGSGKNETSSVGSTSPGISFPSSPTAKATKYNEPQMSEAEIEALLQGSADVTVRYTNDSTLKRYFDGSDNEVARIFYDKNRVLQYKFIATYNSEGEILTHTVTDSNGTVQRKDENQYNSDGKIVQKITSLKNGKKYQITTYGYDSRGNNTQIIAKAADGTVLYEGVSTYDSNDVERTYKRTEPDGSSFESSYDADGNYTGYISRNKNGHITYWIEYKYDSQGQRVSAVRYDAGGSVDGIAEMEYDSDGNKTRENWYSEDGELEYRYEYKYDERGMEIGYTYYSSSNYVYEYEYVRSLVNTSLIYYSYGSQNQYGTDGITYYTMMGDMDRNVSVTAAGKKRSESEYSYDDYGNRLGHVYTYYSDDGSYDITEYDADGHDQIKREYSASGVLEATITYEYEYDRFGNVTKKQEYKDGKLDGWYEYSYDSNGVMTGYRAVYWFNSDGSYTVYEYDADYNQIGKTEYNPAVARSWEDDERMDTLSEE